jgi:hypothetical protein
MSEADETPEPPPAPCPDCNGCGVVTFLEPIAPGVVVPSQRRCGCQILVAGEPEEPHKIEFRSMFP